MTTVPSTPDAGAEELAQSVVAVVDKLPVSTRKLIYDLVEYAGALATGALGTIAMTGQLIPAWVAAVATGAASVTAKIARIHAR